MYTQPPTTHLLYLWPSVNVKYIHAQIPLHKLNEKKISGGWWSLVQMVPKNQQLPYAWTWMWVMEPSSFHKFQWYVNINSCMNLLVSDLVSSLVYSFGFVIIELCGIKKLCFNEELHKVHHVGMLMWTGLVQVSDMCAWTKWLYVLEWDVYVMARVWVD